MTRNALTRRALAAGSLGAALAGSTLPVRAQGVTITVNGSGGSLAQILTRIYELPFTQATGIRVRPTAPVSLARLRAMVETGNMEWDLTEMGAHDLIEAEQSGWVQAVDWDVVDPERKLPELARHRYGMVTSTFSTVLAFRTDKFGGRKPSGWADFWDVRGFPGPRALQDSPVQNLEFALLADGVPMASLYPLDIPRAFASFAKIRDKIHTFYPTDAISANLLSTGEVDLLAISNGRIQGLIDERGDYAIEWNQHMKVSSGYSILRGAANLDNAYRFIDFAMSAPVQAAFSALIPYGPTNAKAFAMIEAKDAAKLPTNPAWTDKGFYTDAAWWGANLPEVTKAWNAWASR